MKKLFLMLLMVVFCCTCACPAMAEDVIHLYDDADLLTDSEELALMERMEAAGAAYQVEFVIVTTDTLDGYSSDSFAEYLYDELVSDYGLGYDGVLLLVAMEERDYSILSNGSCAAAIGMDEIESIGEEVAPHLTDEEYADAFAAFIDESAYWINGEINGFPFNWGISLLISLAIGLVIALIVTGIMRMQLKSVRRQPAATEYTKPGSMQVTAAHDLFLYRTVTFHKKQTNSSSGSSGGSRNVGGGSF